MNCNKRLRKELEALAKNADSSILLNAKEDNLREWKGVIKGPEGSPYENYSFELSISVGHEYPMSPPTIKFVTKCFHPNVNFEVCNFDLNIVNLNFEL